MIRVVVAGFNSSLRRLRADLLHSCFILRVFNGVLIVCAVLSHVVKRGKGVLVRFKAHALRLRVLVVAKQSPCTYGVIALCKLDKLLHVRIREFYLVRVYYRAVAQHERYGSIPLAVFVHNAVNALDGYLLAAFVKSRYPVRVRLAERRHTSKAPLRKGSCIGSG